MTFPYLGLTIPLLKDVNSQMPRAICAISPEGVSRTLTINHRVAPFDKRELRRAMALSLDRKVFIDIMTAGHGDVGGVMQPLPEGIWGMPPEILHALPGYDPDVEKNRTEARQIMEQLGYGASNRLKVKLMTRDLPAFRDPAVLLIDQLKEVYIDGDLEPVDTTNYFPRMVRRDFSVALSAGNGGDDPDQGLYTTYVCNAENNRMGYCNPEVDELTDRQSREADQERRKRLVWDIERKVAEDGAQPAIYYNRGATCWQPHVKGLTIIVNSIYNGWRMEDVWLDK
jgi:peptide/nickel transport system substrate-binding protein